MFCYDVKKLQIVLDICTIRIKNYHIDSASALSSLFPLLLCVVAPQVVAGDSPPLNQLKGHFFLLIIVSASFFGVTERLPLLFLVFSDECIPTIETATLSESDKTL